MQGCEAILAEYKEVELYRDRRPSRFPSLPSIYEKVLTASRKELGARLHASALVRYSGSGP